MKRLIAPVVRASGLHRREAPYPNAVAGGPKITVRSYVAPRYLLTIALVGATLNAQSPSMKPTRSQPEPTGAAQQQIRQARGALFDNLFGGAGTSAAAGPLEATDPRTPPRLTTYQIRPVGELPAAFSDSIVVGRITAAQAYLSNDHTAIYTESTIEVEQVPSQQGNHAVAGGTIVLEQVGGSLELPGGRVLNHLSHGLGEPFQVGQRYAFFLTYVESAQCYRLVKAWWLNAGAAQPVSTEDIALARNGASQYNGLPESAFIGILKTLQASYKGGN